MWMERQGYNGNRIHGFKRKKTKTMGKNMTTTAFSFRIVLFRRVPSHKRNAADILHHTERLPGWILSFVHRRQPSVKMQMRLKK
jgi:hypothetical protein